MQPASRRSAAWISNCIDMPDGLPLTYRHTEKAGLHRSARCDQGRWCEAIAVPQLYAERNLQRPLRQPPREGAESRVTSRKPGDLPGLFRWRNLSRERVPVKVTRFNRFGCSSHAFHVSTTRFRLPHPWHPLASRRRAGGLPRSARCLTRYGGGDQCIDIFQASSLLVCS